MNRQKPDLLRQTDGFERIHVNLTVSLIATSRDGDGHDPGVRVCRADDSLADVGAANIKPIYDYLPVEGTDGHIVGLFSAKGSSDGDDEFVRVGWSYFFGQSEGEVKVDSRGLRSPR